MDSQVLPVLVWEPTLGTPVAEVKHTLKTRRCRGKTLPHYAPSVSFQARTLTARCLSFLVYKMGY